MVPNPLILFGCAFIPMLIAFIWYHPKVFGKTWQKAVGMSDESFKAPPKWYQFIFSFIGYFFLAFGVYELTVHQAHVYGLVGADADALNTGTAAAFMAEYGQNFLTATHGIGHAIIAILAFVIPFTLGPAIWEKKGIKYFFVNAGYWVVSLTLMSIIIAQWGGMPVE